MLQSIVTLLSLFSGVFSSLWTWFRERKVAAEARELVKADIAQQEAKTTREATTILVERRTNSDLTKRLDDGSF